MRRCDMNEYERSRLFHGSLRREKQNDALEVLGYYVSPPAPIISEPEPITPSSPRVQALVRRHEICLLIDRGLTYHGHRLFSDYWRGVQTDLREIDAGEGRLPLVLAQVIKVTDQVAIQCGESYGPWNLMEAAAFQTWAKDVVAALERYGRDCESLREA
jgi:hypothetical protein